MADELVPSDPLPVTAIQFPTEHKVIKVPPSDGVEKVNVEEQKALDSIKPAFDAAAKEAADLEKAHDPLGAILEKNVTETRDLKAEANAKDQDEDDVNNKFAKFYLSQPSLARIHTVLKARGMDSQQSEQALREIKAIIEG